MSQHVDDDSLTNQPRINNTKETLGSFTYSSIIWFVKKPHCSVHYNCGNINLVWIFCEILKKKTLSHFIKEHSLSRDRQDNQLFSQACICLWTRSWIITIYLEQEWYKMGHLVTTVLQLTDFFLFRIIPKKKKHPTYYIFQANNCMQTFSRCSAYTSTSETVSYWICTGTAPLTIMIANISSTPSIIHTAIGICAQPLWHHHYRAPVHPQLQSECPRSRDWCSHGNSRNNKGRSRPGQQRLGFSSLWLGYIND